MSTLPAANFEGYLYATNTDIIMPIMSPTLSDM
jgi:hypothetical protein